MGAAAALAFLTAADKHRSERRTTACHQHADTFGSAELVRRQRHQIDVRRDLSKVEPTRRLNRIGVHHRVGCGTVDNRGDLGDIGDGADLVVDSHHADH